MEQLRSLIKKLLQFRFVRFCITGGLNTLVDFIVFFLLTGSLKWPVIPSQVISYSAGILNSYCINRRWTFQTRNRFFGREMLWFIGVNLCVLGVSVLSMWVLTTQMGFGTILSKLCTTALTMVLGFVLNRLLVFRSRGKYLQQAAMILVLGGGIGNLIDRVLNGEVVDYINLLFMRFAVFNFADICVCVGVGLWVLVIFLEELHGENAKEQ